jgi:molybdopterin-guanine dinucleotide biosynthesis protein A
LPLPFKGRGRDEGLLHVSSRVKDPSPQSSPLSGGARRITRGAEINLSAVLLAGGESRRMGRDKATIPFHGVPLWQVQLLTLRKVEPVEIFISAPTDPMWRPDDVVFVPDVPPSRGPLSGVAASLDRISTTHLLALAIDMPSMTEEYLKLLCALVEAGRGVVPKIDDRAEPLAAIYPREAAIDFRSALTSADFSLQALVRNLVASGKLQEISVAERDRKLFLNMNVPSDLASE